MNPHNQGFGVLHVMNDDLVQPNRGFGAHPHSNMEIITYVVNGELTHQDTMGTKESLGRGSIQFMTAGSGVMHSEFNLSPDKPLRFIQSWVLPRRSNLPPNYGSMCGKEVEESRQNQGAHLVSDTQNIDVTTPVKVNQDINVYVTELEENAKVPLLLREGRQAYLLCVEGSVSLQKQEAESESDILEHLDQHDALEVQGETTLELKARGQKAHLLLFEMQRDGSGRIDL